MTKPWNKPDDARERTEGDHEYRIYMLRGNRVAEAILLRANDHPEAEKTARAISKQDNLDERILVEPILRCAGCDREMVQPDPRGAKRADGSAVYPDPEQIWEKRISCIRCGPLPAEAQKQEVV